MIPRAEKARVTVAQREWTPREQPHGEWTQPPAWTLLPAWTGEQIRTAEQPMLDAGEGPALMRRAAFGLAQQVLRILRGTDPGAGRAAGIYGRTVVGLIGSGNNGGDGLYALAQLRRRGVDARAVLTRDHCHQEALKDFLHAGGRVQEHLDEDAEILIDAVVGTGFAGAFDAPQLPGEVVVVACDVPSGVDSTTGEVRGTAIRAEHTVTFGGLKTGLLFGAGPAYAGEVHTVPIGLQGTLRQPAAYAVHRGADPAMGVRAHDDAAPNVLRRTGPAPDAHKYSRGVVHVLAGSAQYPGAALLSSGAALGVGAGMVQLQTPAEPASMVLQRWPEVVITSDAERAAAVVIGPGLGEDPDRMEQARALLQDCREQQRPCVLDASGLGLISAELLASPAFGGPLGASTVLTPHLGEARKLAQRLGDQQLIDLLEGKPQALRAAVRMAELTGAVVVLKGPSTVIADSSGQPALVHAAPAPGLATAGTGDVLAGIIGALLATQDQAPLRSAALGVAMHAAAANRLDPRGRGRFGASSLLSVLDC